MTYKLGKDGWPTDETVVDMRDREIESLRQQLAETQEELRVCQQEAIGYREQLAESELYIDSLFQQKIEIKQQLAECQAQLEMAEAVIAGDGALIVGLKNDLTECQADNKRLRDALKSAGHYAVYGDKFHAREVIEQALAMPSDSTALDTLKKQWQREALLEAMQICLKAKDNFPMMSASADNAYFLLSKKAKELEETK